MRMGPEEKKSGSESFILRNTLCKKLYVYRFVMYTIKKRNMGGCL